MSADDDALADVMAMLRREYLAEAPVRVAEFAALLEKAKADEPGAADALQRLSHQLAGSAGSYGFDEVSVAAREAEHLIKAAPKLDAVALRELTVLYDRIRGLFDAS